MSATYSTHHPHGPEDPRFLDDGGRCLLCGLAVKHDRERVALEVEAKAVDHMHHATDPADVTMWRAVLTGIRDYDARDPDDRLPAVWDFNHGDRLV
jgi:hypothetical protein